MEGFLWHWASLEGWGMWGENRMSKSTDVGCVPRRGQRGGNEAFPAEPECQAERHRVCPEDGVGGSRNGFEQRRKSLVLLDHF